MAPPKFLLPAGGSDAPEERHSHERRRPRRRQAAAASARLRATKDSASVDCEGTACGGKAGGCVVPAEEARAESMSSSAIRGAVLVVCASVEGRKTANRYPPGVERLHSLDISHASSSACASLLVSPKSRPACCCRSSSSPTRVRRSCQSASVAARSASVCSGLRLGCNASGSQPSRGRAG